MRILFVDDEVDLLEVMEDYCRNLQVEMHSASTGRQALAILSEVDIQVVVSDLNMPQMSGKEFLKKAREIRPGVPFVFWSGYLDKKAIEALKPMGDVEFLEKPFKRDVFKAMIERMRSRVEASSVAKS